MKEKIAKSFKVPKIRRQESKDNLRQIDVTSRDCQELLNIVKRTYINSSYETVWQLKSAALVENRELEERYRAKKADMKEEGRHARDLADQFAVLMYRDPTVIPNIVKHGLRCRQQTFNGLGDSKGGIYLWRNADVQLHVADGWGTSSCALVLFKVILGKCKTVAPPSSADSSLLEPTPNYDAHVPQNTPRPSDSHNVQVARSQIYLYEYTEDCEPSLTPRQCLPYAVLIYERSEKVSKPLQTPAHRYSLKPSERKKAETVPAIPDIAQITAAKKGFSPDDLKLSKDEAIKASDPRFDDLDLGLCVPRLTAGLPGQKGGPASSQGTSATLPSDPRSQLSFLGGEGAMKSLTLAETYQPSFGPEFEEAQFSDEESSQEMDQIKDLNALLKKPKMPSLPPISLPIITDTRQLTDPRFEVAIPPPVDPRIANKPKDPRQRSQHHNRPVDPRLQGKSESTGTDFSYTGSIDPKRGRPSDPRRRDEPRMQPSYVPTARVNDPRQRSNDQSRRTGDQHRQSYRSNSGAKTGSDKTETGTVKKKLSLQDYKKKVVIEKPVEAPELIVPLVVPKSITIDDNDSASAFANPFGDDLDEDVDLRQLPMQPQPSTSKSESSTVISNPAPLFIEPMGETEASIVLKPNVDAVKFPNSQSDGNDNAKNETEEEVNQILSIPNELDKVDSSNTESHVEIVHASQDMAQALNELSDPELSDDEENKSSPTTPTTPTTPTSGPDMSDPALAGAMKMLVEHAANVNLFTEALRSIQESAETYGAKLHDPEFLVKVIAEKIDVLNKEEKEKELEKERLEAEKREKERLDAERLERERMQAEILREQIQAEMTAKVPEQPEQATKPVEEEEMIRSPESIKSPDRIDEGSNDGPEITMKCIPLEKEEDSTMEEAMKKTLEEYDKTQQPETKKPLQPQQKSLKEKFAEELRRKQTDESAKATHGSVNQRKSRFSDRSRRSPRPRSGQVDKADPPRSTKVDQAKSKTITPAPVAGTAQKTFKERDQPTSEKKPKSTSVANPILKPIEEQYKPPSEKPKSIKDRIEVPMDLVNSDEEEDIDLRSGFPSQHNLIIEPKKPKPHIKINLSMKTIPASVSNNSSVSKSMRNKRTSEPERGKVVDMFEPEIEETVTGPLSDWKQQGSAGKFVDPFGLGVNEDVDERGKGNCTDLSQKGGLSVSNSQNSFGDVDFRGASADNSQEASEDFDYRKSHSRSSSPPARQSATDTANKSKPKFVDPFGLSETDGIDKSNSAKELTFNKGGHINTLSESVSDQSLAAKSAEITAMSQDSNSGDSSGALFDAYSLGNKKSSESGSQPSNVFGDVDWRLGDTDEMGDIDMRSAMMSSQEHQRPIINMAQPFHTMVQHSQFPSDPFHKLNERMQQVFASRVSNTSNQQGSVYSSGYSGSHGPNPLDQVPPYSTSSVESYNTSNYYTSGQRSFWPNSNCPPSQPSGNDTSAMPNLLHTLNFANLKNILANVQESPKRPEHDIPVETTPKLDRQSLEMDAGQCLPTGTDLPLEAEDDDSKSQPTRKSPPITKGRQLDFDRESTTIKLPGLSTPPDEGLNNNGDDDADLYDDDAMWYSERDDQNLEKYDSNNQAKPYRSEHNHDRNYDDDDVCIDYENEGKSQVSGKRKLKDDFEKGQFYEAMKRQRSENRKKHRSQTSKRTARRSSSNFEKGQFRDVKDMYSRGDSHENGDKTQDSECLDASQPPIMSTPKRNISQEDDLYDDATPIPNISYHSALLESMERSALKIRSDDSIVTDLDSTPCKTVASLDQSQMPITCGMKIETDRRYSPRMQRESTPTRDEWDDSIDLTIDDRDDDEDGGLVIDLDASEVKPDTQRSSPDVDQMKRSRSQSRASDKIEIEDEEEEITADVRSKKELSTRLDSEGEDADTPKTKEEMTSLIEERRKKMVIKMKGETKKVDPRTGKTYHEHPQGSAIEVLGQPIKLVSKSVEDQVVNIPVLTKSSVAHDSKNSCTGHPRATSPISVISGVDRERLQYSHVSQSGVLPPLPMAQQHMASMPEASSFSTSTAGQSSYFGLGTSVVPPLLPLPPLQSYDTASKGADVELTGSHEAGMPIQTLGSGKPKSDMKTLKQATPDQDVGMPITTVGRGKKAYEYSLNCDTGLAIETLNSSKSKSETQTPKVETSDMSDPLHWFSDKFTKRTDTRRESRDSSSATRADDQSYMSEAYRHEEDDTRKSHTAAGTKSKTSKEQPVYGTGSAAYLRQIQLEPQTPSSDSKKRAHTGGQPAVETKKMKSDTSAKQGRILTEVTLLKTDVEEKKVKNLTEVNKKVNSFGSRILESLSEVKSVIQNAKDKVKQDSGSEKSPVKPKQSPIKTENSPVKINVIVKDKKEEPIVIVSDESELEDGEISDDSEQNELQNKSTPKKDTRIVQERHGDSAQSRLGGYNRNMGAYRSVESPSPRRIINIGMRTPPRPIPQGRGRGNKPAFRGANYAAAEWSNMMENPGAGTVERVKATNIESPSLRQPQPIPSTSKPDTSTNVEADILSKSVATINKAKQKIVAQSQVKTLRDWLKIELETDNIEPLKSIIPFSLDTDLTVITKTRRRKIRLRVKTLIEQECLQRQKEEQTQAMKAAQVSSTRPVVRSANPQYAPELHNDELEREINVLSIAVQCLKTRIAESDRASQSMGSTNISISNRMNVLNDKKLLIAMTLVESEMKQLLSRPCFYGYPHRKVPKELLLDIEHNTFKSPDEDVFLILMTPISNKPYNKLQTIKENLQNLLAKRLQTNLDPTKSKAMEMQITSLHHQRQSLLRSFTGYLNKKRIQKIQETVDKYTEVYDYFKSRNPPTPDSMLKYIRTTQMDLRQHLILSKQYLALEEQKTEGHLP